jgi:RNA polymerase sigma factor (TIGR02999 family)
MGGTAGRDVSALLVAWRGGDRQAFDQLVPLVYGELHSLADRQLRRERPDHSLQTTALLHEAYLRLVGADVKWEGRVHFFAVAAQIMRRVLVDHARARARDKRGGGAAPVTLEDALVEGGSSPDVLDLDEALGRLSALDERKARAVELHYFGGLTYDEVAVAMEISPATVHRELRLAKAWLYHALKSGEGDDP